MELTIKKGKLLKGLTNFKTLDSKYVDWLKQNDYILDILYNAKLGQTQDKNYQRLVTSFSGDGMSKREYKNLRKKSYLIHYNKILVACLFNGQEVIDDEYYLMQGFKSATGRMPTKDDNLVIEYRDGLWFKETGNYHTRSFRLSSECKLKII